MKRYPHYLAYLALGAALILGFAVTAHGEDKTPINLVYDATTALPDH